MKSKSYKSLAKLIVIFHILITLSIISAVFFIFLYKPLKIYSAVWISSIWIIKQTYGECPLTAAEYKLRILSGEKVKKRKFIPHLLKTYFKIHLPEELSRISLTLLFILSIFVLIKHFFF